MNYFSTLLVAAAFYWALTIFFSFWQAKLERTMERDRARERRRTRHGDDERSTGCDQR